MSDVTPRIIKVQEFLNVFYFAVIVDSLEGIQALFIKFIEHNNWQARCEAIAIFRQSNKELLFYSIRCD